MPLITVHDSSQLTIYLIYLKSLKSTHSSMIKDKDVTSHGQEKPPIPYPFEHSENGSCNLKVYTRIHKVHQDIKQEQEHLEHHQLIQSKYQSTNHRHPCGSRSNGISIIFAGHVHQLRLDRVKDVCLGSVGSKNRYDEVEMTGAGWVMGPMGGSESWREKNGQILPIYK